jgi:hypothetical protein
MQKNTQNIQNIDAMQKKSQMHNKIIKIVCVFWLSCFTYHVLANVNDENHLNHPKNLNYTHYTNHTNHPKLAKSVNPVNQKPIIEDKTAEASAMSKINQTAMVSTADKGLQNDKVNHLDALNQEIEKLYLQKNILISEFAQGKQSCFQKFWVERCINKLSETYYVNLDELNQRIYQLNYQKRTEDFNEKQKKLALKLNDEKTQSDNETQQAEQNQKAHLMKLQFLNPEGLVENSARRLNEVPLNDALVSTEKIEQLSQSIRGQIRSAPVVKRPPPKIELPVAKNVEKFNEKQQKSVKREGDLNNRIKSLDEFVKKFKTP